MRRAGYLRRVETWWHGPLIVAVTERGRAARPDLCLGTPETVESTRLKHRLEVVAVADHLLRADRQARWLTERHLRHAQVVCDKCAANRRAWRLGVKAANADRNAACFGPGRGVTIYGHTADFRLPFHTQVISTNDREALYVIDGLCNHETDLNIQEHYTDTAGYTTHVFGLCAALGFRFAPRIRDVLD